MIRSSVTISLVAEARGGPFVFWHNLAAACRTARELGFDGVEIFPAAASAALQAEIASHLRTHGLALAAMGTGAGWVRDRLHLCLPDAAARGRARAFIRSIIDMAGALQAPAIIGSMQGRSGDGVDHASAMAYLAESLEELGAHAAQYHVPLLIEPLNRYETNLVNNLESGRGLVAGLTTQNVRLLADLFHMNIEETNPPAALRAAIGRIGHVHFVDSNRRAAGLGHLDFAPLALALGDIGYDGFASAEVLPDPDSESAARQTMLAFRRFFR